MTSPSTAAGIAPAAAPATPRSADARFGTPVARGRLAALALAGVVTAAAIGAAIGGSFASATGDARIGTLVERLEHARRVDDLRNQQLRWAE